MKIIRYEDPHAVIHHGLLQPDGTALRAAGDPFAGLVPTGETAHIHRLLAPVAPAGQSGCDGNILNPSAPEVVRGTGGYPGTAGVTPAGGRATAQEAGKPVRNDAMSSRSLKTSRAS